MARILGRLAKSEDIDQVEVNFVVPYKLSGKGMIIVDSKPLVPLLVHLDHNGSRTMRGLISFESKLHWINVTIQKSCVYISLIGLAGTIALCQFDGPLDPRLARLFEFVRREYPNFKVDIKFHLSKSNERSKTNLEEIETELSKLLHYGHPQEV